MRKRGRYTTIILHRYIHEPGFAAGNEYFIDWQNETWGVNQVAVAGTMYTGMCKKITSPLYLGY